MRRPRWGVPLFLLFVAGMASADSIQTFRITSVRIAIEAGDPDDAFVAVDFAGPGIIISGEGAMACNGWCGGDVANPPDFDLSLGAITFNRLQVEIGGHTYDETQGALLVPFFITTFGISLTPSSPGATAILNNNGIVLGQAGTGSNFVAFRLKTPPGQLSLDFFGDREVFFHGRFDAMTTVPEPTTLGLMATGLAAIVGMVRRKRGCTRT